MHGTTVKKKRFNSANSHLPIVLYLPSALLILYHSPLRRPYELTYALKDLIQPSVCRRIFRYCSDNGA